MLPALFWASAARKLPFKRPDATNPAMLDLDKTYFEPHPHYGTGAPKASELSAHSSE